MTKHRLQFIAHLALLLPLVVLPHCGGGSGSTEGVAKRLAAPAESMLEDEPTHLPFTVASRIPAMEANWTFPCSDCHGGKKPPNPEKRELKEDHTTIATGHGRGKFWCMACHHPDDKDVLVGIDGEKIDFDESYRLCGQCHYSREQDFYLGMHGKRVGNWTGERVLTLCVECHDAHEPAIKARAPLPPPIVRTGLERSGKEAHVHLKPWEKVTEDRLKKYGEGFFTESAQ
jgi:hypothetical protein